MFEYDQSRGQGLRLLGTQCCISEPIICKDSQSLPTFLLISLSGQHVKDFKVSRIVERIVSMPSLNAPHPICFGPCALHLNAKEGVLDAKAGFTWMLSAVSCSVCKMALRLLFSSVTASRQPASLSCQQKILQICLAGSCMCSIQRTSLQIKVAYEAFSAD